MIRRLGAVCMVVSALVPPARAPAQDVERRTVGRDLDHILADMVHIWTAPVHASGSDLQAAGLVAGGFVVALLGDQAVMNWIRAHPTALPLRPIRPFSGGNPLGSIGRSYLLVPISVSLYAAGLAFDDEAVRDAGLGCAASNAATTLAREAVTRLVGRPRPRLREAAHRFEPFAFGDWDHRSFPSGHAANMMACVSYWDHRFDLGLAEPLLYAIVGVVSGARVLDEAHWPSDVVLGLAWGFAVGRGVAARMERRARAGAAANNVAAPVYLAGRSLSEAREHG